MDIDIDRLFGAVTREIATRDHEGRSAKVANVNRVYDTDIDDLWDALTNPDRIPRWFLPVGGDLRLGGRYQLEGNAGGAITACEPPRRLAATWEYGDEVSWIELALSPVTDGRTRLALEHIAYVDDERWAEFGPGAVGVGWDLAAMGLDLYLASGQANDPQAVEAWTTSEVGRDFIARCSEDWARASIADGTPREQAMDAAARTTAFYTGLPPETMEAPPSQL